jgi:hypothetical protein
MRLLTLLAAGLPVLAEAQVAEPTPTKESATRILEASDGYVRVIARALKWKAPTTQGCQRARLWIEDMAKPLPRPKPAVALDTPQDVLELYQRAEENTMARHAMFSRQVYEAVRQSCLVFPEP